MLLGALKQRGGRTALWLVVGLLIGALVGALGAYLVKRGKSGIPGGPRLGEAEELSLVPGEAFGFVHIRARELWQTEGFAELRKIVEKAGPKALEDLDKGFVPAPSSLDRLTLVALKTPSLPDPVPGKVLPPPFPGKKDGQPPKGGFPKGGFPPPPPPLPVGPPKNPPAGFADGVLPPVGDLKVVFILAFNQPFDANKVRETYLGKGQKKSVGGREYWDDAQADLAAYFSDDKVMVLGDSAGMKVYLTKLTTAGGPLTSAIELARKGGRHIVASLNMVQFGFNAKMFEGLGTDLAKELLPVCKAESLTLGLALGEETKIDIRAKYKDAAAAGESEAALRNLAKLAREQLAGPKKSMDGLVNGEPGRPAPRPIKELPMAVLGVLGLGSLNALDEWLADPPLTRDDNEVVLTPKVPSLTAVYAGAAAAAVGWLVPATEKVRIGAARVGAQNNLHQIGLAMHNYAAVNKDNLPMPAFTEKMGTRKPGGLSWRVHLLPYVEEVALYQQFHLDEPWDSPHNKALVNKMPKVYASPNVPPVPGKTYYKVCTGPHALFDTPMRFRISNIPDGTSNTILVVEGGAPVAWTAPEDFVIDADKPLPDMKLNGNAQINVALADGSVRTINLNTIKEKTLRNAIDPADGEVLPPDW
jgi:hypothetical protein